MVATALFVRFAPAIWQYVRPTKRGDIPVYTYRKDLKKTPYDYLAEWPTDAEGLCDHLNNSHQLELEAINEPSRFPRYWPSGETHASIRMHQELVSELGYRLCWNGKTKQYEVAPEEETPAK